jgi:AcrR family transcriptional regulator
MEERNGRGRAMTSAATQERLVQAARQCLLERGHQACSVKVIAGQAGVNHGLVHHYFGSKEQLWLAVLRREAEQLRAQLTQAPERFMDDFFVPALVRHPDRMRLFMEFLALARTYPAVAQGLREQFRLNRAALQRQLGLEDPAVVTLAFAALFGLAIQAGLDPELKVEPAAALLLERLAAMAGQPQPGPAQPRHGGRHPPPGR